jgi:hypothetical protein
MSDGPVMSLESARFDLAAAHRHFSAECFNRTWTLLDQPNRTPADNQAMIQSALASLWHWTQRPDVTNKNLSIGHWLVSRVYALSGWNDIALHHALESLKFAQDATPFYIGFAHEAAARAALGMGDKNKFREHLDKALSYAAMVTDSEDREALKKDLEALTPQTAAKTSV